MSMRCLMKKVYDSCNIEVDIPSDWSVLNQQDVNKLGIANQPEVDLLDVFLKKDSNHAGIISFQNYGNADGFIEAMDSYMVSLAEKLNKAQANGEVWSTISPVKPLEHRIVAIKDKKFYAIVFESANNSNEYVVQIYFLCSKKTYCLCFNVDKSTSTLDEILDKNILAKDCIDLIMSAKKC